MCFYYVDRGLNLDESVCCKVCDIESESKAGQMKPENVSDHAGLDLCYCSDPLSF